MRCLWSNQGFYLSSGGLRRRDSADCNLKEIRINLNRDKNFAIPIVIESNNFTTKNNEYLFSYEDQRNNWPPSQLDKPLPTCFKQQTSGDSQNGFNILDYGGSCRSRQTDDGSIGKLTLQNVEKFVVRSAGYEIESWPFLNCTICLLFSNTI